MASEEEDILILTDEEVRDILDKISSTEIPGCAKHSLMCKVLSTRKDEHMERLVEKTIDMENMKESVFFGIVDYGFTKFVKMFIEKGIDVNAIEKGDDRTALIMAAEENYIEIVKLLIEAGADVNKESESTDIRPLDAAAGKGNHEVVQLLLEAGAKVDPVNMYNCTALGMACFGGCDKCVELLIKAGSDINMRIGEVDTATPLLAAAGACNLRSVTLLLEAGAEVDVWGREENTPLHLAAMSANSEILQELIKRGCDLNTVNEDGETALDRAISYSIQANSAYGNVEAQNACSEAVKVLLEAGADVSTGRGNLLSKAVQYNPKCVELLEKYGAK